MKCSSCDGPFHPATGHVFTESCRICGTCARDFYNWYKKRMGQMQARIKKKGVRQEESFHDSALRSVVGDA